MSDGTRAWRVPVLAAAFAIAIRLPFLGAGYGWDSDAWRMAGAAQTIAATGSYVASRAPGYPLTELTDALLARVGPLGRSPWATNGLRALESALAAAAFAALARRMRAPAPLALACAFTSVPAIFIAGTTTLDAMGSLAFGTVALVLAHARRPVPAGLAAGVAAGLRPTGVLFLLPIAALLARPAQPSAALGEAGVRARSPRRDTILALSVGLAVATLGYAPALLAGGMATLGYYDLGYPSWLLIVKKATVDLWGPIGCLGLGLAVAWTIARGKGVRPSTPERSDAAERVALVLGLLAFGALYLRLPYKALYLAPAVPFALLLFARWARPAALRVALGALLVSPWAISIYEPGKVDDPAPSPIGTTLALGGHALRVEARGAVAMDRWRREEGMRIGERAIEAARRLPGRSLVVAGDWLPMIRVRAGLVEGPAEIGNARFVHHLTADDLAAARAEGRALYVLPGAAGSPSARFGIDARDAGARALERSSTPRPGVVH